MRLLARYVTDLFCGLRFRLLVLVAVVCAPLVGLTVHRAGEDRRRAVEGWRHRSQQLNQLAVRQEDKLIDEARRLLGSMGEADSVRTNSPADCRKLVNGLFVGYPQYANLAIMNGSGDILASAIALGGRAAQADRAFLRQVLENGTFAIDNFPSGRVSGKPVVKFGYPVFDEEGRPVAAVYAALDLTAVSPFGSASQVQLPSGATWTELDRNGTVVFRYPAQNNWNGKPYPDTSLVKQLAAEREGVLQDDAKVPTVYAFASTQSQLVSGDTVMLLAIPKENLFAAADRALAVNLSWLGLAAGLALFLGWFGSDWLIIRPVKALVRSSTRLATGDLTARTGLPHGGDELGRLTYAFDLMAQALEQREMERSRASHKLQILSHRLVEVQENERRHIARELHDEIGQSLTVAEMNLQAALRACGQAPLTRRLEDSIQAVERVLSQVHDLSLNLRPSMLDDLGLEAALRWYTNRQAALTGLQARFRGAPLHGRLDPVVETECFRVAQEALTNVVRHSGAQNVAVELEPVDGQLHLRVRDDGRGFDVGQQRDEAVRGSSLGLLSMEERASLAGGGLELISAPSEGTEVHAWFPLKWRKQEEQEEVV
jgi:signal transduction histidine kinase